MNSLNVITTAATTQQQHDLQEQIPQADVTSRIEMSSVKALKDELEQSVTKLKRSQLSLRRAITDYKDGSSTRSLELKLSSFEKLVDDVGTYHTSWMSKAGLDEEQLSADPFSSKWLEGVWAESDEICDSAREIIHGNEVPTTQPMLSYEQQLLIVKKKMSSFQLSITKEIDTLNSNTVSAEISSVSGTVYTDMCDKVRGMLETPYKELSDSILTLSASSPDIDKIIDEHE